MTSLPSTYRPVRLEDLVDLGLSCAELVRIIPLFVFPLRRPLDDHLSANVYNIIQLPPVKFIVYS
jgi:hypothetical protein